MGINFCIANNEEFIDSLKRLGIKYPPTPHENNQKIKTDININQES